MAFIVAKCKQNAMKIKVPFYGSYTETDPVTVVAALAVFAVISLRSSLLRKVCLVLGPTF